MQFGTAERKVEVLTRVKKVKICMSNFLDKLSVNLRKSLIVEVLHDHSVSYRIATERVVFEVCPVLST